MPYSYYQGKNIVVQRLKKGILKIKNYQIIPKQFSPFSEYLMQNKI
jgi:hypothetical protein